MFRSVAERTGVDHEEALHLVEPETVAELTCRPTEVMMVRSKALYAGTVRPSVTRSSPCSTWSEVGASATGASLIPCSARA